jgi:hypothetical protein
VGQAILPAAAFRGGSALDHRRINLPLGQVEICVAADKLIFNLASVPGISG